MDAKPSPNLYEMPTSDTPLATAKTDAISPTDLANADGIKSPKIWVAVKGYVFDVSSKPEMYGPGGQYHVFAGKDGSKGLGSSSLKPEDATADYSTLDATEMKVLDDWLGFFQKRYDQIGKVSA